ncbi:hypothetical protein BCR33DRAFT_580323 [Rhizoclosmatium globosum]|uniref:Sugar phosphate transporter domain-containing protein n=1 Tax=Rhizoclosmatium globosum TaxID=329046 RepID=A0A1Y2CQM0_9FUNG|nr:hypothetical protein BCR33DRAFT_580323 [Rhizoclosmatium globosum]|eukprot:ORY49330.1 hypothetical protein BCR33DRAFT_580323 [Rhizoclosmatium globosum]
MILRYISSSALSICNKHMLGGGPDNLKFNYPLLLSCIHSIANYVFTSILLAVFYKHERKTKSESLSVYLHSTVPTAFCAVLDIGLSNASLQYISLSFYTIVKSIVPVWVLVFSVLFGLERMKLSIFVVISLMCLGVALTVMGEIHFSWFGFVLIQSASMSSGLRWSLTQLLLRKNTQKSIAQKPFSGDKEDSEIVVEEKKDSKDNNPIKTLHRLSPVMAIMFAIGSLWLEATGVNGWIESPFFQSFPTALRTLSFILFGACLALGMTLSQFYVVLSTSV